MFKSKPKDNAKQDKTKGEKKGKKKEVKAKPVENSLLNIEIWASDEKLADEDSGFPIEFFCVFCPANHKAGQYLCVEFEEHFESKNQNFKGNA